MYYIRPDNTIVACKLTTDHAMSSYGNPVLVDSAGTAYGSGDIDHSCLYWSTEEAGKVWGVGRKEASRIMPRVPGYRREVVRHLAVHMVPHGSKKPEPERTGPKRKE